VRVVGFTHIPDKAKVQVCGVLGTLEHNPELWIMLHIFEQHLPTAAVIELCRPTVGVADPVEIFRSDPPHPQ
jgi:hypothetical protein